MRIGVDPMGGASVAYWAAIRDRHGLDLTVTNENVELPVLDGFRMLERLGDARVDARADGVGVLAGDRAAVIYHHEDAWWVEGARPVTLTCAGAGRAVRFWRAVASSLRVHRGRRPHVRQSAAVTTTRVARTRAPNQNVGEHSSAIRPAPRYTI